MRYIERIAVLLAACILLSVVYISRQDVPPAQAVATVTPSACSDQGQRASAAKDQLHPAARVAPAPVLSPAELLTLPRQIQEQVGSTTLPIGPADDATAARPELAEHVVLTLPWQIQQQVRSRPAAMDC